jgi:hypothetical protein
MCSHNRTINEEVLGHVTAIALKACPELPPEASGFPAAETVVHRIPVAKLPRQIPPGNAGAGDIEDRLDEQPVTQFRRATGFVFDGGEPRFNLSPGGVGEEPAYGHQRFPP